MPTDFEARRGAAVPTWDGGPRSMSLNGTRAVIVERCETHLGETTGGLTGQRAHLHRSAGDAVNGAFVSRSGSSLVRNPVAVPRSIAYLDFSLQCQLAFLDNGFRCDRPAAAYVEFHMVGYCKRFDCDDDGNACGYVCGVHLKALEYTAECIARELQPVILVRWLSRRVVRCPTCDRLIRSASDILQRVVML